MSHALNLYALSRIRDEYSFGVVEQCLSGGSGGRQTRRHEMGSLRILVDRLLGEGVVLEELDGYFFGYTIPHIGKEFDLLKLVAGRCLSVELKSEEVALEKIRGQLLRNRHYLSHLKRETLLYTVVTEPFRIFRLDADGELREAELSELTQVVHSFAEPYSEDLSEHFRAVDFLVSPVNAPERFLRGEYFLTQEQDQIRREIVKAAPAGDRIFHVSGRPGTGKTLLLYDLAKVLAKQGETLVIHCGLLNEGHRMIEEATEGLSILSDADLTAGRRVLADKCFVLVDESQRMEGEVYGRLLRGVRRRKLLCVFFSDEGQILTASQRQARIAERIARVTKGSSYHLHTKIRTNREIYAFISGLMDRKMRPREREEETHVFLNFAADLGELKKLLAYYRGKGFVFIHGVPAKGPAGKLTGDLDVHQVIGQEFDRVVMVMDGAFAYDAEGVLQGKELAPQLLYQGATRAREELALIVLGEESLFRQVVSVLE